MLFNLKNVIDEIGSGKGYGTINPHSITIHHDGVKANTSEDPLKKLRIYTNARKGVCPYHVYIPYNTSDDIYVANYLNKLVWHNTNGDANRDAIAISLAGNFDVQAPHWKQLEKLRWLLDNIDNGKLVKNGWTSILNNLKPRDSRTIKTYTGYNKHLGRRVAKKVKRLHYHNQVSVFYTACCGKYLKNKITDYSNSGGNVKWAREIYPPKSWNENVYLEKYPSVKKAIGDNGFLNGYHHYLNHGKSEGKTDKKPKVKKKPKFDPVKLPKAKDFVTTEHTKLYDFANGDKVIKEFLAGEKVTVHYKYNDRYFTSYSIGKQLNVGFLGSELNTYEKPEEETEQKPKEDKQKELKDFGDFETPNEMVKYVNENGLDSVTEKVQALYELLKEAEKVKDDVVKEPVKLQPVDQFIDMIEVKEGNIVDNVIELLLILSKIFKK